MEYVALTGISDIVMSELKEHLLRTLEIRSPQNFITSLGINVGDHIFITHTSAQDIMRGTPGVVVQVVKHQVSTHRTLTGNDTFYEEHESMIIRLQLKSIGVARINNILSNELGKITSVDAEQICFYEAR
ncbi:DUF473 domain-containing protein [Methanococcoides alaskense]|uniref:DUF473 domain-containing protein n=1 Tax=Methanococcoides alaskense TaxID=325778 RepID=A0AA90U150_9EURY|nr:DUF473 domain-containing protein [Methanococcoides alaskense]MDA0525821.1 DUF473 domain-containing protein [Methanococcoides alaskense]MDR6223951.1 hypothetical protein [Methanococcoides alaskense]